MGLRIFSLPRENRHGESREQLTPHAFRPPICTRPLLEMCTIFFTSGATILGIAELEASDAADRAHSIQDQAANEAAQVARERADQLWKLYGARQEKQDLEEQLQGASDALGAWIRLAAASPSDVDLPLSLAAAQARVDKLSEKILWLDRCLFEVRDVEDRMVEIARTEYWDGRHRARLAHKRAEERARDARYRLADLRLNCPVCRLAGRWRLSGEDERKEWTEAECSVCLEQADGGVLYPCFHSLCQVCCELVA